MKYTVFSVSCGCIGKPAWIFFFFSFASKNFSFNFFSSYKIFIIIFFLRGEGEDGLEKQHGWEKGVKDNFY